MRNVKQLKNMMNRTEMIKKAALYPNSLEAIFFERIDLLKGLSPEDLWEILLDNQYDSEFLYPIKYKGRSWDEGDCAPVFCAFYKNRDSFNIQGSIDISNGYRAFPDGRIVPR